MAPANFEKACAWWAVDRGKAHIFGYSGRRLFWMTVWFRNRRTNTAALQRAADDVCRGKPPREVAYTEDWACVETDFEDVTRISANAMPGELEICHQPLGLDEQRVTIRPPRRQCLEIARKLASRVNPDCVANYRKVSIAASVFEPLGLLLLGGLLCVGLYVKALDVEAGQAWSGSRRSWALGMLIWAGEKLGSGGARLICIAFGTFCLAWIVHRILNRPPRVEYKLRRAARSDEDDRVLAVGSPKL